MSICEIRKRVLSQKIKVRGNIFRKKKIILIDKKKHYVLAYTFLDHFAISFFDTQKSMFSNHDELSYPIECIFEAGFFRFCSVYYFIFFCLHSLTSQTWCICMYAIANLTVYFSVRCATNSQNTHR